jgi:hypothetical protein
MSCEKACYIGGNCKITVILVTIGLPVYKGNNAANCNAKYGATIGMSCEKAGYIGGNCQITVILVTIGLSLYKGNNAGKDSAGGTGWQCKVRRGRRPRGAKAKIWEEFMHERRELIKKYK